MMHVYISDRKTQKKLSGIAALNLKILLLISFFLFAFIALPSRAQNNQAPSIAVPAVMNGRAMVVINGGEPKTLAIGQSHQGVELTSIRGNQVSFRVAMPNNNTQAVTVNVGAMPVSLTSTPMPMNSGNSEISIPIGQGGHFYTSGYINNKAVYFVVDTGATSIAMGQDDARRLGIDFERGQRIVVGTANGNAIAYRVQLRSVRIQNVEVSNVEASVSAQPMPYILLGNSFLNRFDMTKTHNRLVLRRRY